MKNIYPDRLGVMVCGAVLLSVIGLTLSLLQPPLTVNADGPLPPRDPPLVENRSKDKRDLQVGAYILLQVDAASADTWSVIQWLGDDGNWYDVEGWRGSLNENGTRQWWVDAKDFGTGPFRWVVFSDFDGNSILGASTSFKLPSQANKTLFVSVSP